MGYKLSLVCGAALLVYGVLDLAIIPLVGGMALVVLGAMLWWDAHS